MKNKVEDAIYHEYIDFINNNMELCREKSEIMSEYLHHSPLFYDGELKSKTLMIPKVYTKETFDFLEDIMKKTNIICKKVVDAYLSDASYREIFPFSNELQDLILAPRGYDETLPISRFDIFFNEETKDFGFCEFNTDGTSCMDEDRVHNLAYIDNPAHQHVLSKYDITSFELFDTWVDEFIKLYHTWENAKDYPRVAIVDFPGAGRFKEFKEFARRFQRKGAKAYVCDIRSLKYDGKTLRTEMGYEIDAIYRRSVTGDVLDNYDTVTDFLNAVRDGRVFMTGGFCTQLVHNKFIFTALHHEKTAPLLTSEEREFVESHIPKTVVFTGKDLKEKVLDDKDSYILKTQDSYASFGVLAGVEFTQDEWVKHVEECFDNNYLCQDFFKQYRTQNIDFMFGDGTMKPYLNMTGLYSFNGKLAGFANRQSEGSIIRTYTNERLVPSYLLRS